MSGLQDFITFEEDFLGAQLIPATATAGVPWLLTDTSSAGAPTALVDAAAHGGILTLLLAVDVEAENLCLNFGNKLNFDIDKLLEIEFLLKTVATLDTTTTLAFGLSSDRNDNTDSTTANAQFKLVGSNAVVVETDDGATDKDDIPTGVSLVAAYQQFIISFASGTKDVRFSIGPRGGPRQRVAASTVFDMSGYTAGLQPFVQLQKTSDSNADSVSIDYIRVSSRR